jgi:hypothetical protein
MRSGLEHHVFLNPFSSQIILCTTWRLDPKALASPGVCIVVALLSVLRHGCFKDSPDCHHAHPSLVPKKYLCMIDKVHVFAELVLEVARLKHSLYDLVS